VPKDGARGSSLFLGQPRCGHGRGGLWSSVPPFSEGGLPSIDVCALGYPAGAFIAIIRVAASKGR
jgi:hypothetical protein